MSIVEALEVLKQKFLMQEGIAGVSYSCNRLRVYVESELDAWKVPEKIMGFPVDVKVIGRLNILQRRTDRFRPVPGGVSIGSIYITAGTCSGRVYDLATGARVFLSNRHVFYGPEGTPILQPGRFDGGRDPDDRVATVYRYVEVAGPPETNLVDAGLGMPVSQDLVSDEVIDLGVIREIGEAKVGDTITKSGRSCGTASAVIMDVNATVKVHGYWWIPEGYAIFEDQIITTYVAIPGDSGSLGVVNGKAIGLLFAGSPFSTVFCKVTNVCRLLNVNFSPPPPPSPPVTPSPTHLMVAPLLFGIGLIGFSS